MANDLHTTETADFGAGYELLEALKESGLLTESKFSIINSHLILENRQNSPTNYSYNGRLISWDAFMSVYTDYDRYEDIEDIWRGLGFPRSFFEQGNKKADENMRKALDRITSHFLRTNNAAAGILVTPGKRMMSYSRRYREAQGIKDDSIALDVRAPNRSDIYPGQKNRKSNASRVIERINSQELLSGEFYSDISRIPPSRWGNWLRFWDKQKTPVRQTVNLIGRSWKKTFVLGYQVEANLVYEIWYNSLDSSFSLHDYRGNQVTRSFATMSEATKALITALAQNSNKDAAFFSSGLNNPIAVSMFRTMTSELDTRVDDLRRLENKEQEKELQDQKRKEAENERRKQVGNIQFAKEKIVSKVTLGTDSGGVNKDIETIKRWGSKLKDIMTDGALDKAIKYTQTKMKEDPNQRKIEMAVTLLKNGRITAASFAGEVSRTFGVTGTHQEQTIREALLNGEISVMDYIDALRTLSGQIEKYKTSPQTPLRPQPVATGPKQNKPDVSKMWSSGSGSYSNVGSGYNATTGTSYDVKQDNDVVDYLKSKTKQVSAAVIEDKKKKKKKKKDRLGPLGKNAIRLESYIDNLDYFEAQERNVKDQIDSNHFSNIRQMRKEAREGQFTQNALNSSINSELIEVYRETRVDINFPKRLLPYWLNRGRKEPIVLPTDKPGILDKAKMLIAGQRFNADFIVGFSLSKTINVEIWHIVEPNPEYSINPLANNSGTAPTVSSFYVFDVTSGTLLRKFVPYYRNAVQVAMAKLSAQ